MNKSEMENPIRSAAFPAEAFPADAGRHVHRDVRNLSGSLNVMPQDARNLCGSLDAMGGVIRRYRKRSGRTQAGLAEELGVTRNAVISWETGRARPQMEMLMKLSHLLSIPVMELFHVDISPAGLTPAEQRILDGYRQLDPENRGIAEGMIRVLLEEAADARTRQLKDCYRPILTLETPAAAGPGCDYLDNAAAAIHFYRNSRRYTDADVVCRVCGHSMEPYYRDGDYVYARTSPSADDGEDVICDSNDGRMIKRKAGSRLFSLNPDPAYRVHKSEDDDVRITAVVLGVVPDGDRADAASEQELAELHSAEVSRLTQQLRTE